VLDTPTWRANRDWGARLGYSSEDLADAVRRAVALVEDVRQGQGERPILLSGAVGPRGDGYVAGERMTPGEAETYHGEQLDTFADTAVDLVTAYTLTYADEAIGIARAARALGLPVVISFTLETDGRLPSGQSLAAAVEQVDTESDGAPAWYLINCAHPTHFRGVLAEGGAWLSRIAGVRANASTKSHAELDEAEELDAGDPLELGAQYRALHELLPHATVLGGCCGTDHLHVAAMCAAWMD
jgi:S-methylmethionine-dependent homocysteine/selenocysteine methylase